MKCMKSILALAMTVCLGLSAWAADNDADTVKAGRTTKEFSWSYGAEKPRWYALSRVSGDDCVTPQFAEAYSGQSALSDGPQVTTKFTFTAKEDVTTRSSTTWKLWRCSAHATKADTVPAFDPSASDGGKPYSDRSDIWGDCGTYTITVEPADAVIPEDVALIEGHTVRKTLTGGESGTAWAVSVTEGSEYVMLDTTSGTGEEFTCQIHGRTAGSGQVTVTKDGKPVAIYDVKVFDPAAVIHLCLGDVLTLNYNPGAKVWNKSQTSGLVVSTEGSMGQGTAGGEGTANPTTQSYKLMLTALAVGEEEVKLVNRNSSDTIWTTVDDIMIEVSQSREAMASLPVSVSVPGTAASAGSMEWTTSVDPDGRATVATSDRTASGATATVTGKEDGAATVTVKNVTGTSNNLKGIEFAMTFNFSTKPTEDGEEQHIKSGATATLNDKGWTAGWTARSLDEDVATVTEAGAAGTSPIVTGKGSGIAEIWVEDEDIRRVYKVHVQSERTVDNVTAYLGSTTSPVTCGSGAAAVWTATSDNEGVVKVSVPSDASDSVQPQITGVSKGQTTLTVRNDYCIWTLHVTVEDIPPAKLWATILKGQTGNATVDSDTDPMALILTYTTVGTSELIIPEGYGAKVDILAVGGGGSGAAGRNRSGSYYYSGNSGGGGKAVYEQNQAMRSGYYTISVGAGGASKAPTTSSYANGEGGSPSSIAGTGDVTDFSKTASGGSAGSNGINTNGGTSNPGSGGAELTCNITGEDVVYGENAPGASANSTSAPGANGEGDGGQGGYKSASGAGGSGIVVIRITQLKALESVYLNELPTVAAITYGQTLADATLSGGSSKTAAGAPVAGTFAWVNTSTKPTVADSDRTEYGLVFTPNDTTTYKPLTGLKATVTVNKAAVTVTAANKSMTEGGTIPAFSATYNPNITPATEPKYSCAYSAGGAPGAYDIIPYGAADPNCTFTYAKGTLTVNAKSAGDLITTSGTVTKSTSGTTVIYKFTSGTGSLTVPANYKATADILVVGGGGGGGTYNSGSTHQLGNGGNGGSVNHQNTAYSITASTLSITVGAGGNAGSSGSQGGQGETSSVKLGSTTVASATGGTGGASKKSSASAGTPTNGTTVDNVTYGKGGSAGKGGTSVTSSWTASAGAANTGTGGQGGGNYYTKRGSYSAAVNAAAGGSGVVIIKITKIEALPQPTLSDATAGSLTYGQALSTVSPIGAKMNINGTFAWDTDTTYRPTVAESGKQMFKATFTHSNASYWSPVSVLLAVTVSPKQLTDAMVALDPTSFAYNGETQRPTVTVTDPAATITANDYTVENAGGEAVGEYTVTVTGKGNYTGSVEKKFSITRAPAPVKAWPGATEVYVGQTLGDSALTNGVPLVEGEFAWADGTTVLTTAGTFEFDVVFTPVEEEQGKYVPVTNKVSVTVLPGVPVPKAKTGLVYTGLVQTGVDEGVGYTLEGNTATDAGTYEARATLTVPGSCWAGGSSDPTNISWSIAQKVVTVTGDPASKVYSGNPATDPTLTATVVGTNGFDGAEIKYTVAREAGEDVGTYDIVVTVDDADQGNYTVSGDTAADAFEITRKPIAKPTAKIDLEYNGGCQTGVVAATGFVLAGNVATNAGTYTATATLDGNHKWNDDSTEDAEIAFTIAPKEISVTAHDQTVKPGDPFNPTAYTADGLIDPDTLTGELACAYDPETAEVGETFPILQGTLTNANYTIATFTPGTLRVASLQVTLDPAGRVYDGTAFPSNNIAFTVTDNDGNPVTDFLVDGPETMLDAKSYTFKVTANGLEGTGTFVVSQALVTVTAVSTNKVYSGNKATDPDPLPTTVTGLVNGESESLIDYTVSRAEGENVDTYAITPKGDVSQGNYKVTYVQGTFKITPKGVTVKAVDAEKVYGTPDPAFTVTSDGLVDGDSVTNAFTRTAGEDVGEDYVLMPTGDERQGNYTVTYVQGTFKITPATATVTAVSTNKLVGTDDPDPLPTTVEGLVNGDTLDYEVTREEGETNGTYVITVTGDATQVRGNYNVTYVSGVFTIRGGKITVNVDGEDKGFDSVDEAFEALETSGGTATFNEATTHEGYSFEQDSTLAVDASTKAWDVSGNLGVGATTVTRDIVVRGQVTLGGEIKVGDEFDEGLLAFETLIADGKKITLTEKGTVRSGRQLTIADVFSEVPELHAIKEVEVEEGVYEYTHVALEQVEVPEGQALTYNAVAQTGVTETVAYALTGNVATNAGAYTATATLNFGYYWEGGSLDPTNIEWSIGRRAATVTAVDTNKLYGTEEPVFTTEVEGFIETDDTNLTWKVWRTNTCEEVGEYDLIVSGKVHQASYEITYVPGTFEIRAGMLIVNGRGYDDVDAAFAALASGGTAYFNEEVDYERYAFRQKSTLSVDGTTGAWRLTGPKGCSMSAEGIPAEKDLTVEGTLQLWGDVYVGPDASKPTLVTATNLLLGADITVGVWTGETATAAQAILTCQNLVTDGYWLTLTTNGVIRSAKKLEIDDVFDEPSAAYEVVETEIAGGWEYTAVLHGFTITFNSNGGSAVEPIVAVAGEWVEGPEDPERTGYGFAGWYTNDVEVTFPLEMPMMDFTLDAHWTPNDYTVAYDPNDGEGQAVTNKATYDVEHTVIGRPADFAKTGYSFGGWTTNLSSAVRFQPGDSVSNLTAEADATVTMYAVWTANVYQVTYDANGGTGEPATSNATYDAEFAIAGNPGFTKTGYTFESWTNAAGEVFAIGAPAKNLSTGEAVTLYAAWEPNGYTLTYRPGEGTGDDIASNMVYDVWYEVADCTFAKPGYSFREWTNEVGTAYQPGTPIRNLTDEPDGNVDFTAVWTANVYTVTYDANGGEGGTATSNATYDVEFAIAGNPDFAKTGYSFNSWTNAEGEVFAFGAKTKNLVESGNATLYAKWTPNAYTVKYDPNGGDGEAATSNATYDVEFAISDNPGFAKTGYTFESWTNAEGEVFAIGAPATNLTTSGEVALYAAWEPNAYTLTYLSGTGESAVSNLIYDVEYKVADCMFERTGYTFMTWADADGTPYVPGFSKVKNLTDEPNGNVDFTAQWEENQYTLIYAPGAGATGTPVTNDLGYTETHTVIDNPGFERPYHEFGGWTNLAANTGYEVGETVSQLTGEPDGEVVFTPAWIALSIPVAIDPPAGAGYAFVVSNLTDGVEITKEGGKYPLPIGTKVGIYSVAKPGYEVRGEPLVIDPVTENVAEDIAKATLPTAEKVMFVDENGVLTEYTGRKDAVTIPSAVDGVTITGVADGVFNEIGTKQNPAELNLPEGWEGEPKGLGEGPFWWKGGIFKRTVAGDKTDPWRLDDFSGEVIAAWTNETGALVVVPTNANISVAALADVVEKLGEPPVLLTVAEEEEEVPVKSIIDEDGNVYRTLDDLFEAEPLPETVRLYVVHEYTLTYKPGEGEGEDVETNLVYDVEHTVIGKPDDFAKTGYSFKEWTDEDGKAYLPGEIVSNLTSVVDGNVDFTAVWTANVYQVTYDANGGTGEPATSNATYDAEFAIAGNPGFAKTGYTFESWTNAAGEVFAIGAPAKNLSTGEAVTLYAEWTPNTYRLVCTAGEGTGTPVTNACTYDVEYTVPGKPDGFAKTGYSFTGWADGEDAVVTHLPGETFSNLTNEPNAVVTWAAAWTANVYMVTFDPNGGSEVTPNPIVASCGDSIDAPTAPTRKWYEFAGWFDGDDEFTFPTTMPAGGAALTAKWDAKQGAPENPWKVGPNGSTNVLAHVDPDLGTVVLELYGTNEVDLVALTNGLVQAGEEELVRSTNFNATVKTGEGEFMTPAGWLDANDPNEFAKTLAEALVDGLTSVLVCEDEPPAKIVEKAKTETGDIVTATVENDPGAVPNAIQASAVKGLIEIAADKKENVRFSVEAKTEDEVKSGDVEKLLSIVESVEGLVDYRANYVDLSVFIGERQVDELDKVIDIYIPWTFDSRYSGYKMSCIHGDSVEEIPFGAPVSGGSEYFEKAADGRGFILHMSKFCDCLLAEIEASSSITTVMDDGTVIEIDVSKGIYDFKPPTKQGYLLSLTGNDGQPVVAGAPVRSGVVSVTAEWVRRVLWEKSEGVIIDNPYNVTAASVWDGYVVDAAGLTRGTIQLKVAKPNKKTGISKVTATVLLTGEKKVSIKGETADGRMTVTDKTGRVLDIVLSESAVAGTYGGMEIDGSRNMFTAKDAVSKSRADDAYARWQGVYVVVLEDADGCYGGVTLTVAKKGKIKVSGALADGTKVSGNTQLLIGERNCACAFSYTKKDVSTSFLVWFCTDGTVEISNLSEGGQGAAIARHATGAALEANAVCQISAESIVSAFGGGVNTEVLPNGTPVWQEGTKWKVAKAGKVAYKNGAWTYTGDNLAGVKLTYTAKTAIFKGSFTVYNLVNGKLKKIKVTVNGVMLDGKGYGTATVKKPVFRCPITVEKPMEEGVD